ncbi:hypothetical protein CP980_12775 [Streptomyces vinaceus]|uniref:DUF3885 domain-containing protein n=1 Tax=Streptomyces vinaceus TaxID=1960 RepID=A0A5J6JE40_STRVI|nr:hypothetical protein CP980_12775 [Streptomyces vinaceus]GHE33827.1 hypothetical protein GCM10017778_16070 [Streptomyces vinaceus]
MRLKTAYSDRWVRFHSLPEPKRYAADEEEYAIVLDRYNTVLDELFAGGEVYVVTPPPRRLAVLPPLRLLIRTGCIRMPASRPGGARTDRSSPRPGWPPGRHRGRHG